MRAARVALVCAALTCAGCATAGAACMNALGELTAQLLCSAANGLCASDTDADDHEVLEPSAEESARRLAEAPPPVWQPDVGRAACETVRADGLARVSCADGTRATFLDVPRTALTLDETAAPQDGCEGRVRKQGVDADGDGALSAIEVWGRVLLCDSEREVLSPSLDGDLAILEPEDVVLVAARRAITGGLLLAGGALVSLELPQLRSVGGSLRGAFAPSLERASFERLAWVGGDISFQQLSALAELELPEVADVRGSVVITDNPRLPQRALERIVIRLSRKGFAGPVVSGGNGP